MVEMPFDANLAGAAALVLPDLERYRVDGIIPIYTVPPTKSSGLAAVNRTLMNFNPGDYEYSRGEYENPPDAHVGKGILVDYMTDEWSGPATPIPIKNGERDQVDPALYDMAAQGQLQGLVYTMDRRASGVYTAANYSSSTSDLAALPGADGKKFSDLTCDVVRNLRAGMYAFEEANGHLKPDTIAIGYADLKLIGRNTTFRSEFAANVSTHSLGVDKVVAILEAELNVYIDVRWPWPTNAGGDLWGDKVVILAMGGPRRVIRDPQLADPLHPLGRDANWKFGGGQRGIFNARGQLVIKPSPAALILEEIPALGMVDPTMDPQFWGIRTGTQPPFGLVDRIWAAMSGWAGPIDEYGAYVITTTR